MEKIFIIDGQNFDDFDGFCVEFSNTVLRGSYIWSGNLDAFNDILRGDFADIEYDEKYTIIWKNSCKSKEDLGYNATIYRLQKIFDKCHDSHIPMIYQEIEDAKKGQGKTLFDLILEIIDSNKNVKLILEK